MGPGLSNRSETGELVLKLIEEADVPLVIDADGLNLVAKNKDIKKYHTHLSPCTTLVSSHNAPPQYNTLGKLYASS